MTYISNQIKEEYNKKLAGLCDRLFKQVKTRKNEGTILNDILAIVPEGNAQFVNIQGPNVGNHKEYTIHRSPRIIKSLWRSLFKNDYANYGTLFIDAPRINQGCSADVKDGRIELKKDISDKPYLSYRFNN